MELYHTFDATSILSRLEGVLPYKGGWKAFCPACGDGQTHRKTRGLSIKRGDTSPAVLHCHRSKCSFAEIIGALGLDLPPSPLHSNGNGSKTPTSASISKIPLTVERDGVKYAFAASYDYVDEHGEVVACNARYETPGDKTFLWLRTDSNGGFFWGLGGIQLPPYRLPEMLAAFGSGERTVYLVEGEKDADALRALGLTATNSKNWKEAFNAHLPNGVQVVIFADHDTPGGKIAKDAAKVIAKKTSSVKIIDLYADDPTLTGADVSDWIDDRRSDGQPDSDIRDQLERLSNDADKWEADTPAATELNAEPGTSKRNWPALHADALHGIAGEFVRRVEPHTEADTVAVLIQMLAAFGCIIGRSAYFRAGDDQHFLKLFIVLVGATASGRKGTSWSVVRNLMARVDGAFLSIVQNGLSTGEGLIHHVRDRVTQEKITKDKKTGLATSEEVVVDPGAPEKRAFITEPEFARVLKVISRDGNTLSSVIRQSWDTDRLSVMTKTPVKATDAHIAICGHVTETELAKTLTDTEAANGFANRFLWLCVKRSKYLPDGGSVDPAELNGIVADLQAARTFALSTREMKRDGEASELWRAVYPRLSDGFGGMLGSVTSRATAQVMRIACIYALLDCSNVVRVEHLTAALAVWHYCEDSAKYIFGMTGGDRLAEAILAVLQDKPDGISKTEIYRVCGNNLTALDVNSAVQVLVDQGRIERHAELTPGAKRPSEIIKLLDS